MARWERLVWPASDFSRVPTGIFIEPEVFEREQERIFQGPVWLFLGLEAEIPEPGDYFTTFGGVTPLVVNRAEDGRIHVFVNRCSHRGALVVRDLRGRQSRHICAYHRWCYDLRGSLVGTPFRRGVEGKGGLPPGFDRREHGLRPLRVASYRGAIFASFDPHPEPLPDYLGPPMRRMLDRLFCKPIEILGHLRHRVDGNWKAYFENLNDSIHAGLLHRLPVMLGLWSNTQEGAIETDPLGRHAHYYVKYEEDDSALMGPGKSPSGQALRLADHAFIDARDEWGDRVSTDTLSLFPNVMFAQVSNFLITEQIRPKSAEEFELLTTVFGYADDDPDLRLMRQRQVAWLGPAGYVGIEDNEAGNLIQRASRGQSYAHSYIGYGGVGPIGDTDHLVSEVSVRGFWRYYCYLMGYQPQDGPPLDPATWAAEAVS
ncbi:MAG: Rieske 2Fe-2S domain-containing protein [Alphaproteobacteria bacterium]|nr:Rieske 2Fe-2S domain-containing protein [Alphaproteobacteria bacterium]